MTQEAGKRVAIYAKMWYNWHMAESSTRASLDTRTTQNTEALTVREQIIRARNLWPELAYIPTERPDEPENRKNIRTAVREKLNDPRNRAVLEARADQHAKGYPKEERAKAKAEFIKAYLEGAESFAIAVSESAPQTSFPVGEVLLVYAQEFESLYSEALEKKASRGTALGIASQSYRFDTDIITDTFEALGITPETPDEIRAQVLSELAETTHVKPNSVLEQVYAHRYKRDHTSKDKPLVPKPETPQVLEPPHPVPLRPDVPDTTPAPKTPTVTPEPQPEPKTPQPEVTPQPQPEVTPQPQPEAEPEPEVAPKPKTEEPVKPDPQPAKPEIKPKTKPKTEPTIEPKKTEPTTEPAQPETEPEPEPDPVKIVETKPIEASDQSDRVVEEENRKGQYLIPLDQARPLKRITGFSEKEKRAALQELANYLRLTHSDPVNGIERRAQSWSELHTRIRKFKIARQQMYAEGKLTTEDTKDVFELTFPVAWDIVELFRDESEKGLNITNAVHAIRYAHQAGLFLTDVTWDNRTVGWRIGVIIGNSLRRQFDKSGDTLPAGYTSIANRFFTIVSHLEKEAHEPLQFNVQTFLRQNKELARYSQSFLISYKHSLSEEMVDKERGAAAIRLQGKRFVEYGLVKASDVEIFAKNYSPREPVSMGERIFDSAPLPLRRAYWWIGGVVERVRARFE